MAPIFYEGDDWDFCITDNCVNLFRDACPGPSQCPLTQGKSNVIQIFAVVEGKKAQYVTSIVKKH